MENTMTQIVEALTIIGRAQTALNMTPTVRVRFKQGSPYMVAASFRVVTSLDPGELVTLKNITGINFRKGESPFGFPMWYGQNGILEFKIHCKACPPGYEMVSKVGSRGKVTRRCQLIKKEA